MSARFLFLPSPISLAESSVGAISITHRYVDCADIVSEREAFTTGKRALRVKFDKPLRIHELREEGRGVWMTDLPIELRQMWDDMRALQPSSKVLIGGLGLGIVATWAATHWPSVDRVDVAEINPEVAQLISRKDSPYNVIVGDIMDLLRRRRWSWDCAYLDMWQGTGESAWWDEIFPLRRLIANRFGKQRVAFRAERMMWGQIIRHWTHPDEANFRLLGMNADWHPHWYYRTERPLSRGETLWFLRNVGTVTWERKYGKLYEDKAAA